MGDKNNEEEDDDNKDDDDDGNEEGDLKSGDNGDEVMYICTYIT